MAWMMNNSHSISWPVAQHCFIVQEKLKMDTLRCRAYTRQKVIQRTKQVDRLEKQVTEATQKINAVSEENKRYV